MKKNSKVNKAKKNLEKILADAKVDLVKSVIKGDMQESKILREIKKLERVYKYLNKEDK